ncbi:MAG: hypothetical protein QNI90_05565 [Dinoroseobacter sp.]|nr:hypothetical protein [Dinoroseobacter sp.]
MKLVKAKANEIDKSRCNEPMVSLAWTEEGKLNIDVHGDWERIVEATPNTGVIKEVIRGLSVLGSEGNRVDEATAGFALGFVDIMKPRDAIEVLLLSQMAATHQATMTLARRLNHVETLQQQEGAERAFNKLARTFTTQMQALKRYRAKAQQTVRVERVTVEDGGQAIVGSVEAKGADSDEK